MPKPLIWDHAPPHKPPVVKAALATAGIQVVWLPFRAPELSPMEDRWRYLKQYVAANRVFTSVDALATATCGWLDGLGCHSTLSAAALLGSWFDWLPI